METRKKAAKKCTIRPSVILPQDCMGIQVREKSLTGLDRMAGAPFASLFSLGRSSSCCFASLDSLPVAVFAFKEASAAALTSSPQVKARPIAVSSHRSKFSSIRCTGRPSDIEQCQAHLGQLHPSNSDTLYMLERRSCH